MHDSTIRSARHISQGHNNGKKVIVYETLRHHDDYVTFCPLKLRSVRVFGESAALWFWTPRYDRCISMCYSYDMKLCYIYSRSDVWKGNMTACPRRRRG